MINQKVNKLQNGIFANSNFESNIIATDDVMWYIHSVDSFNFDKIYWV